MSLTLLWPFSSYCVTLSRLDMRVCALFHWVLLCCVQLISVESLMFSERKWKRGSRKEGRWGRGDWKERSKERLALCCIVWEKNREKQVWLLYVEIKPRVSHILEQPSTTHTSAQHYLSLVLICGQLLDFPKLFTFLNYTILKLIITNMQTIELSPYIDQSSPAFQ